MSADHEALPRVLRGKVIPTDTFKHHVNPFG